MYNIIVLLLVISPEIFARDLPSYIKKCHVHDNNLNSCLIENFEIVTPHFANGIPEFKVPPLEPLRLEKVTFELPQFRASFLNCTVAGATTFEIRKFDMDVEKVNTKLEFFIPHVKLAGKYQLNGKIMMFELKGEGESSSDLYDLLAIGELKGHTNNRNGKKYLNFNETILDLKIGKCVFHFSDLFPNNKALTETTNSLINENSEQIVEEFKGVATEVIGKFLVSIIEDVFNLYSVDELFIMD